MPGADEGGHSPTRLHELLAEARAAGIPRTRSARAPDPARRGLRAPSPAACLPAAAPTRLVDLGSGGGLPGLVVATDWPEAAVALLEANGRRAAFLRRAVERLGLSGRVAVLRSEPRCAGASRA